MSLDVRQFLVRPGEFFDHRAERLTGVEGAGVAVAVCLLAIAELAVVLWAFTQQFAGSMTIDNPDYPGDQFCSGEFSGGGPPGCSEPVTVTVEISSFLWEQIVSLLPWLLVGLLLVWFGLAVLLHIGSRLVGGTGGFGQTLAVTSWGLVPTLVTTAVAGVVLVAFAVRAELAASSLELLFADINTLQSGVSGVSLLLIQLGGAAWQAFVWTAGMQVAHGLSREEAVVISALVAAIPVILS